MQRMTCIGLKVYIFMKDGEDSEQYQERITQVIENLHALEAQVKENDSQIDAYTLRLEHDEIGNDHDRECIWGQFVSPHLWPDD